MNLETLAPGPVQVSAQAATCSSILRVFNLSGRGLFFGR